MAKKYNDPKKFSLGIYNGHGMQTNGVFDPGTTYKGRKEEEICEPITQAAVKDLRRLGFTVFTDAFNGNKINMYEQVKKSNEKNVDVHVALHLDWYEAPKGTYPIAASDEGEKLAKCINKAVKKRTGMTVRGILRSGDYYETNATNMPAVIYECGDIEEDYVRLKKADVYGKAIAEGICDYLRVKYVAEDEPFKVRAKKKLVIRETASTSSKKVGYAKKGVYTIVKTSYNGTRGKLKSGAGWITITDKFCEKL